MYHYWGFGLLIASEIEFPELLKHDFTAAPDVIITIGTTPHTLTDADVQHTPVSSISPTKYLLKLFDIGNYLVTNGNSIVVEPLAANDSNSLRLFLLNSVMSALLYQRNNVMLNASAIEFNDGLVLFCGPSNSGKSALAAGMLQRGYKIFSDEVCLIRSSTSGGFEVTSSYPVYKLWKDCFKRLGIAIPAGSYKIRPDLAKYGIFYHEHFNIAAKPIKQVYILKKHTQLIPIAVKKADPVEGFTQLHNNSYYRALIYPMKKQPLSFMLLSKLANAIPLFDIEWYDGENSTDSLCDLVEKKMHGHG